MPLALADTMATSTSADGADNVSGFVASKWRVFERVYSKSTYRVDIAICGISDENATHVGETRDESAIAVERNNDSPRQHMLMILRPA